jgi:hypothetical protein
MGKTIGHPVPDTRDPNLAFGYPETAILLRIDRAEGVDVHTILYAGAPSTLFDSAPNCSELTDYTNGAFYIKVGTPGGTDGTWLEEQLS